jgi:hypothetical protein
MAIFSRTSPGEWVRIDDLVPLWQVCNDRPRVALDFDGVITDPHALKGSAMRRYGYDVSDGDSAREICVPSGILPLHVYEKATREVNVSRLLDVPPAPGALEAIRELAELALVVIVTAREDDEVECVLRYLDSHEIPVSFVLNTSRGSKKAILQELAPRVYVEDFSGEFTGWDREPVTNCMPIYFTHIANRPFADGPGGMVKVADGWREVLALAVDALRDTDLPCSGRTPRTA